MEKMAHERRLSVISFTIIHLQHGGNGHGHGRASVSRAGSEVASLNACS